MWSKGKKCEQIRLDISENVLRNSILKNYPKISKKISKKWKKLSNDKITGNLQQKDEIFQWECKKEGRIVLLQIYIK